MDVHVEGSVTVREQVTDNMLLGSTSPGLLNQVLVEVYSGDSSSCHEPTDHWELDGDVLSSSNSVRKAPEHVLTCLSAVFFVVATEETNFYIVDLYLGNDATCTLKFKWSHLLATAVTDSSAQGDCTDEVFANHEDWLSQLLVS